MKISEKIIELKKSLPEGVDLIAVSKTHTAEAIMEAYSVGQRAFGESRPQELAAKAAVLPSDIQWHMIGHLQTNKVKMVVPIAAMIHSVDSERLLTAIDKEAVKAGRTIDVLLEVHVADEQSKHGWAEQDLMEYLESGRYQKLSNIRFRGLMTIASNTEDMEKVGGEFAHLAGLFASLRTKYFPADNFDTLSMGMTSDYPTAIAHGSTMVRIGSLIFN